MKMPAQLSAALLLLLLSGIQAASIVGDPISFLVTDSVTDTPDKNYTMYLVFRGILLGGMKRLQNNTNDFTFTYHEDPNYGPFLDSVNGLPGSTVNSTYWMLQVKTENGTITPNVGIGCYIPNANDQIILNYTRYEDPAATGH